MCSFKEYYSVTSDMLSGLMKDIAAENVQAYNIIQHEEADAKRQIDPRHVWITGASTPACYSLIPMLAGGEVFGRKKDIWLHLLDGSHSENALQGLKMEAEDLAFSCLWKVTLHTLADDSFLQADFVIVLDDVLVKEDQSPDDAIRLITERCVRYGALIDQNASKEVKVIVSGSAYTNLQALIIIGNAPSINQQNIVALPTQLEFEAKAEIAKKLSVNSSAVKDVIIWGNISGINLLDLHQAKVYRLDSSIWGPSSFSRPLLAVTYDRNWTKNDLVTEWQKRKRHRSGLSAANAIARVLSWWQRGSDTGDVVSLGVLNQGYFDLPGDIVYSMPVQFQDGIWHVYTQVTIQEDAKEILLKAASELIKEKNIALGIPQPQDEPTAGAETKENVTTESDLLSTEPRNEGSLRNGENQRAIQEPLKQNT
ncbi:putative malate dehydrogenase 1B isoform X2 [Pseudophryne corroboree]|uniref:putative malate dehydrogenase 1B isoform X2 n=1 Tax=Pseudophryne corroboree TaxID=495146 RepID=UPI003081D36E